MAEHPSVLRPHFGFGGRPIRGCGVLVREQHVGTCEIHIGSYVFSAWFLCVRYCTSSIAGGEGACVRSGRSGVVRIGIVLGDCYCNVLKQIPPDWRQIVISRIEAKKR